MSEKVLILAAGNAIRFDGVHKQLLSLGNETILERIVRQAKARSDDDPVVITRWDDVREATPVFYSPSDYKTTCNTILSTFELWNDRTIVLLGDVMYTKTTMDAIFADNRELVFFGNMFEIYALSFKKTAWHSLTKALEAGSKHRLGKIRYCYRSVMNYPLEREKYVPSDYNDKYWHYIDDYTTDVDTRFEYLELLRNVVNRNVLDDLRTN